MTRRSIAVFVWFGESTLDRFTIYSVWVMLLIIKCLDFLDVAKHQTAPLARYATLIHLGVLLKGRGIWLARRSHSCCFPAELRRVAECEVNDLVFFTLSLRS